MELFQIRYFLKVADLGNFTRAAAACGVSQPALSQAIQKLEAELGQPVFERLGRRVSLTDAGRLLLPQAEQITRLVEEARQQITDDGDSGCLRIAAIPTIAPYLLPKVLQSFSVEVPAARFELFEEVTEQCLKRCRHGEVDLAIVATPIDTGWLEFEPLFEEDLHLVLPSNHELLGRSRITLADVKTHPFILLAEAHCLSDNIRSFCDRRSFLPTTTGRFNQLATVLELVAIGQGISFIPQMARCLDESPRRTYRTLAGERPRRGIAMCWNSYRYQNRLQQRFVTFLRERIRDFSGQHSSNQ